MADFLDVGVFRERGDGQKPFYLKIGSAKTRDNGEMDIWLEALPIPTTSRDGKIQVHLRVSPKREKQGGYAPQQKPPAKGYSEPMDDEIPF